MIQFNMNRFMSVARWDMTINKKFYLSQVAGLGVLAVFPVVLAYMFWWSTGRVAFFGAGGSVLYPAADLVDFSLAMGAYYGFVTRVIPIVYLGYMFHNLVRKQGRIVELTLPASNVERFTWHAVFCLVAPLLAFACAVICADVINMLFATLFGIVSQTHSLTHSWLHAGASIFVDRNDMVGESWLACAAVMLSLFCYTSTFALGNAWKYRYNIILTFVAHVLFWVVLAVGVLFVAGLFVKVVGMEWINDITFDVDFDDTVVLSIVCLLLMALLVSIWALTYRLYCRAQVTSRRNR